MLDLRLFNDLTRLAESAELECKLAQGQDGRGELPKDFWPTYSAMANAHGGVVLLGVREALVNTLIHADYSDRASVLVIKQPSGFVFRNPGLMRVPAEAALHGGASDCRNRSLHRMFLLINLGERAGSGVPKIRAGWEAAGHGLALSDGFEPFDQTRLEMLWGVSPVADDGVNDGGASKGSLTIEAAVLALLRTDPTLTVVQLAKKIGKAPRTIERHLQKLRERGVIKREGSDKPGRWEVLD